MRVSLSGESETPTTEESARLPRGNEPQRKQRPNKRRRKPLPPGVLPRQPLGVGGLRPNFAAGGFGSPLGPQFNHQLGATLGPQFAGSGLVQPQFGGFSPQELGAQFGYTQHPVTLAAQFAGNRRFQRPLPGNGLRRAQEPIRRASVASSRPPVGLRSASQSTRAPGNSILTPTGESLSLIHI